MLCLLRRGLGSYLAAPFGLQLASLVLLYLGLLMCVVATYRSSWWPQRGSGLSGAQALRPSDNSHSRPMVVSMSGAWWPLLAEWWVRGVLELS
jgi:hypothetical protein